MSRFAQQLIGVKRVAWYASAIIDYASSATRSIAALGVLFQRTDAGSITATGSVLIRTEILTANMWARIKDSFAPLTPVSETLAERAFELRRDFGLRTVDAVHIATAVEDDTDAFVTCDADFLRVQNAIPLGDGRTLRVLLATQY